VRAILIHPTAQMPGQFEVKLILSSSTHMVGRFTTATTWAWRQGTCEQACPVAEVLGTEEWMPSRLALPHVATCPCAHSSVAIMQYIATLLTLLRADGVRHVAVTAPPERPGARAATSREPAGGHAATVHHAVQWVRISLSERRHVLRDRSRGGS
jgi:hypothetical protein